MSFTLSNIQADPADRRGKVAAIVAAARTLFLAQGYGATSMDAVARAAPVSKRTLYHHFESKAALFGAVVDQAWAALRQAQDMPAQDLQGQDMRGQGTGAAAATDDPRAVLRQVAERMIAHWEHPDVLPLLRLVIAETPRFPELAATYYTHGKSPALAAMTEYFARLATQGRIVEPAPALRALQFLGPIKEALFWPRLLGVPQPVEAAKVIERAIDGVLADLAPPGPGGRVLPPGAGPR